MSFFLFGAKERIGSKNHLVKLTKLINWSPIAKHLKGIHKNEFNSKGGPKAYDNLAMFKALLVGQWHNLSDPALEEALKVRLDFILFTGFEMEDLPDETTLCRFRNKLIGKKLDRILFDEINSQLEKLGLKIEKAQGAIIDATIIESAARPRHTLENCERDREESDPSNIKCQLKKSADPDAEWLVKGKRYHFGYKGFIVTDTDQGFITKVHVTPANFSECKQLPQLVEGMQANRVLTDKGYASKENRIFLKSQNLKDGIMHKAARNSPLKYSQRLFNKLISMKRFIVERAFGTLKRKFRFDRASYFTMEKVEAQLRFKAMCFNLLKGINLVKFA